MTKKQLHELDVTDEEFEEIIEEKIKDENKVFKFFKELIPYIIILVVVVSIRTFFVTPIIVNGESMKPTLDGGELMLLNKRADFKRFSIVVVDIKSENLIKRIIALPGETVSCERGVIYVNDHRQSDDYGMGVTPDFDRITLKEDEYFVLGDNRENSLDSQDLGPFKKEQLKGVSNFILFPFKEFGKVS